ncbi:hypothetical protein O3M35_008167 [Rhynocoris fuscipes]|uniref:PAX-interacting protein 1 n=1 Tax=Rhynocoris fuscipes TaxID=488301 RepID=A0AAW1D640_9HEMI
MSDETTQKVDKYFANVKFKTTGNVSEEILTILKDGGADCSNYFSDFLTHLIVGEDPSETDISDAKELYEIPAVSTEWVLLSKKCGKMLPVKSFIVGEDRIFTGITACLSEISKEDCTALWSMITFNGGTCTLALNNKCTHLIVGKAGGAKYNYLTSKEGATQQIVTPDWVVNSLTLKYRAQEALYHPRLIIVPQIERKVSELSGAFSTAHITGFADDDAAQKEESAAPKCSNELLEQLKQRMPWNQQTTTTSALSSTSALTSLSYVNSLNLDKEENKLQIVATTLQHINSSNPSLIQAKIQTLQQPIQQTIQAQKTQLIQQSQQRQQTLQWRQPANIQQLILHQQLQPHQQLQQQQTGLIQQQVITQQHPGLVQQSGLGQGQPQSNLTQQTLIQAQPASLGLTQQVITQTQQQVLAQQTLHNQSSQSISQQQIITSQQPPMLLSPQNQHENTQFISSQPQIIQTRTQQIVHPQSKQVIQQQQFIVRESAPQLVQQQQYAEAKTATQFTWQQQYGQNRPQIISTQQPQVQQRQITWMQQPQAQGGTRQLIQMDAQTHAQLQQMDPQQRALFLQRLQKQRQLVLQRQLQQQNRGILEQNQVQFGVVRTNQPQQAQAAAVIRGQIPSGLNPQHQLQWLQQQRQNQIVLQQSRPQVLVQQQPQQAGAVVGSGPGIIRTPGPASQAVQHQRLPINVVSQPSTQQGTQAWQTDGNTISPVPQANQLHLQRLQQIQMQQKQQSPTGNAQRMPPYATQVGVTTNTNQANVLIQQQHSVEQTDQVNTGDLFGVTSNPQVQQQPGLVVNAKTKTALVNMLSHKLQGVVTPGTVVSTDGSASGQLRMMTAQHQSQLPPPPPPPQPFQRATIANAPTPTPNLVRATENTPAAPAVGTPPASHHQRPQFYGHNPNLKLPPDMFLLGCVFLIMEYDRNGFDVTMWRRIILENGGETELSYSLRVTHILCQTQKHPLVQQGIRDGKRCVTAEWLSDVMIKQQVLPPWLALHFPTPFSDEKPCRNLIISHSGFEGEERVRVKKMIEAVGAKMTSYYTSHNNILVCRRPEGEKYRKAREWSRSVVNVQWLTEVLFGHYSCLQHPDNHKYQQFNIGNPFRIDYTLVPHLMGAWKVPIQVTQECYERAKSSGIIGPKRKRPRVASPSDLGTFEQENIFPIESTFPPIGIPKAIVMFSGSTTNNDDDKKVLHLGGVTAKNCREATHLVMYKMQRTLKLLCCLSTCQYIVDIKWLIDSFNSNQFLDEKPYLIEDAEFESKHNCNIQKILANPDRSRLFSGKTFYITPGVIPSRSALIEMIQCAGGTVEKQRKSLKQIQELDPTNYIIITVNNDFHLVSDVIRANIGVYSAEFIMTAILTQKLPYETAFKRNNVKNKI